MPRRQAIGAQLTRQRKQVGELHPHIAPHARDRRPPGQIFVGELLHHRVAKAAFMIMDMMLKPQPIGDRARIPNILPRTTSADALGLGAMIIELQRDADHLGPRFRRQRRNDAGIHPARHCDNNPPVAQGRGQLKIRKTFHRWGKHRRHWAHLMAIG